MGWLVAQGVSGRMIGFLAQIVLARLLVPTDYAIVALAATVTTIVGIFQNFGIEAVLLQRQRRMRFWRLPALVAGLTLGVACMIVVIALAPAAAWLYDSPTVAPMLVIMATGMPLMALSVVPSAELRAQLRFGLLARYTTAELVLAQIATIALAAAGFGAFSFVMPGPATMIVRAIFLWSVVRPPLRRMRLRQLAMIGRRGSAVFGSKLIAALIGQGDYFVLGLVAAKADVGAYFFAYRLAFHPVSILAGNFQSVLYPALSRLRDSPLRQRDAAAEAAEILSFVIMPLSFLIAALAPPLFPLAFGHHWDRAIPLVQILSIALAFDAIAWIAGALLDARGEFTRGLRLAAGLAPVFFLCVTVGALGYSATGAALGVLAYYLINGPTYYYATFRRLGLPRRRILRICFLAAGLSAVAIGIPWTLAGWLDLHPIAAIALIGAGGGGLYLAAVATVARPVYRAMRARMSAMAG